MESIRLCAAVNFSRNDGPISGQNMDDAAASYLRLCISRSRSHVRVKLRQRAAARNGACHVRRSAARNELGATKMTDISLM